VSEAVESTSIDLGTADVLFEVRADGVAVATLNRPDTRNALSGAMGWALSEVYRRADTDDAIRVVVLTGTPPAFCAGADFSSGSDVFESPESSTFSACPVEPTAWQIRKPVIAAVNGHAIGIGFTLALHCDIRILALDAKYGVVQVRRGVMPDAFSHWTLPRIAGMGNAADILLTGRTFLGSEAKDLGLANRVLPNDEVLPAALELAHDMAVNTAPVSVAVAKRLMWGSFGLLPAQVEHAETELHHHVMGEADAREGVHAFLERREPRWSLTVNDNWPAVWPAPEDVL
jgi:enoyl-CoA hydratase/carnithine racemase